MERFFRWNNFFCWFNWKSGGRWWKTNLVKIHSIVWYFNHFNFKIRYPLIFSLSSPSYAQYHPTNWLIIMRKLCVFGSQVKSHWYPGILHRMLIAFLIWSDWMIAILFIDSVSFSQPNINTKHNQATHTLNANQNQLDNFLRACGKSVSQSRVRLHLINSNYHLWFNDNNKIIGKLMSQFRRDNDDICVPIFRVGGFFLSHIFIAGECVTGTIKRVFLFIFRTA